MNPSGFIDGVGGGTAIKRAQNFLAIVVENSAEGWVEREKKGLTAQMFLEQLLVFVRGILLLDDGMQLVVLSVDEWEARLLYGSPGCIPWESQWDEMHEPGHNVHKATASDADPVRTIIYRLEHVLKDRLTNSKDKNLESDDRKKGNRKSVWSSAMLRSLCIMNRYRLQHSQGQIQCECRMLCLKACRDDPVQYLATMNSIFACQRADIKIDACMIGDVHSGHMQQATYLTGGVYFRALKADALAQYLLTACTSDISSRQYLRLPHASGVDFRASCFCHKRPISVGFVCSVCLSIFCERIPTCTTCGTEFQQKNATKLR